MTYDEAEQIRAMIDGHWNLRMDDATADLWLGALVSEDAQMCAEAVAKLAKTLTYPPKIKDLQELLAIFKGKVARSLPPAPGCPTCSGDRFVLVGTRPPVVSSWMKEHDIKTTDDGRPGSEEYAPCPDCNAGADTAFHRYDGLLVRPLDPAEVRARMRS